MTYEEAREFIEQSNRFGSRPGLAAITELLKRLGNPQDELSLIHVAGTNGKGSTTAYIVSILSTEGYRIGRYISPSVFSYREKIQIGTEYISKQGVAEAIEMMKPLCEAMVMEGYDHPTAFEIETAMAFLYFLREKVDAAVIEVGLGGRLDATNVIKRPLLCIITSISMDHMQYLGDTIEKITSEKAGIIKKGATVITSNSSKEVLGVLRQASKDMECNLYEVSAQLTDIHTSTKGTNFCYEGEKYEVHLLGEYQAENAALAIRAAYELRNSGFPVSDNSIKTGLALSKWNGRLEIIADKPYFILDGAHNEDAAIQLKSALLTMFSERRKIFIMGVLADKDYKKILKITAPLADVLITVTPDNLRALDSAILAKEARFYTKAEVIDAKEIRKAVKYAYDIASKEDVILAFGSLSYLKEIKELRSELM